MPLFRWTGGLHRFRATRTLLSMDRTALNEEMAVVSTMCKSLGLGEVTLTTLKAAHHTTFLVSPLRIVARVQSSEPRDAAWETATKELSIARHLAGKGTPALAPLENFSEPHVMASCVVTFWPYVERGRAAEEKDAVAAAASLDRIHGALRDYSGDLPPHTDAFEHCWSVLVDDQACSALDRKDRQLLKTQYNRLRREADAVTARCVPLHGDPHLGNLLIAEHGPIWLDFEDACLGPREYDIACLPLAAWSRFAHADQTLIQTYADLRSICIAVWCWADLARSDGARDAALHNLDRVREFARR